MGVVDDERAFGADELDPCHRKIRICGRQAPARADHERNAAVHGDGDVLRVGHVGAAGCAHRAVVDGRIHADRLGGLQAPQNEIEVVGRFHRRRRQLGATGDLLAEAAADMAAHQRADRLAERAVGRALFDVREFRVEALRVADREFERILARDRDELVGLVQLDCNRLFEEHMLAGGQGIARHGEVQHFRRGRDHHGVDRIVMQNLLIVGSGRLGARRFSDFSEALGPRFGQVQGFDQRMRGAGFGAYAAAPAGAYDADVDLLQGNSCAWMPTGRRRAL